MLNILCRLSAVDIPYGNVAGINGSWLTGNSTDLDTLKLQNTLKLPLIFAPGTGYCYTNANFNLAGYVIEKVRTHPPFLLLRKQVCTS